MKQLTIIKKLLRKTCDENVQVQTDDQSGKSQSDPLARRNGDVVEAGNVRPVVPWKVGGFDDPSSAGHIRAGPATFSPASGVPQRRRRSSEEEGLLLLESFLLGNRDVQQNQQEEQQSSSQFRHLFRWKADVKLDSFASFPRVF